MIKLLVIFLASCSTAAAAGPSGLGGTPLSGSIVTSNSIVTTLGFVPASSSGSGTTPAQVTNIVATLSPTNGETRNFSFIGGTWTFTGSSYIFSTILDQALAGGSGSSFVLADAGGILYLTNLLFGTAFYSNANAFALSPTNVGILGQVLSLTGNKTKWITGTGGVTDYKLNYTTQDIRWTNIVGGDLILTSDGSSLQFVQGLNEFANLSGNHITFDVPTTNIAFLAANAGLYVGGGANATFSGSVFGTYAEFTSLIVGTGPQASITESGDVSATSFTGSGANLTTLDGDQITFGTVADNRLSSNVALKDSQNHFTDNNFFGGTVTATNGFITITNNAQVLSAITFPATTVKWTNNFGMNIFLYINNSGVTGTALLKNNQQIFSTLVGDITIGLKPGDYFAATYSIGTPSARWEPQ